MCLRPLLYYFILQVTSELLYQLSGKHILMGFAELNCLLCGIFDRTPVPSVSPDCISHVQCFFPSVGCFGFCSCVWGVLLLYCLWEFDFTVDLLQRFKFHDESMTYFSASDCIFSSKIIFYIIDYIWGSVRCLLCSKIANKLPHLTINVWYFCFS